MGQPLVKFLQLYDVFGRHVTNTLTTYRKHSAQHHFWLTDRRTEEDPLCQSKVDMSRILGKQRCVHALQIVHMQFVQMRHPGDSCLSTRNRGVGRYTRTQR